MPEISGCDDRPPIKAYRVVTPHFVAGFTACGQKVITTAPILRYMAGGSLRRFENYAKEKGWQIEELC